MQMTRKLERLQAPRIKVFGDFLICRLSDNSIARDDVSGISSKNKLIHVWAEYQDEVGD
jgi:hypothetical protein